jgi:uncharacterized membrane protein (UPF0127 family)
MKKNTYQKNSVKKETASAKRIFLKKTILGIFFIVLFFGSMYGFRCFTTKVCDSVVIDKIVRHDVTLLMPKGALQVEVANTKASRELGLSGRPSMGNDEGMLFVFPTPGRYGFWMKDMVFPLDIIWINQEGIVVWIERNVTPESFLEEKIFINTSDASYVLEVNAGQANRFGLFMGSKIKIAD